MESIMSLETCPSVTQAKPHPTNTTRPIEFGKPLTRVTLAPGPPMPHVMTFTSQERGQQLQLQPFGSFPSNGGRSAAEKPAAPKRKPGRPKGTTKKGGVTTERKSSSKKGSKASTSTPEPGTSMSASSSRRPSLQDGTDPISSFGASNDYPIQAGASTSSGTSTPVASTSRDHTATAGALANRAAGGRPRKDELPVGTMMRVRPITPPSNEYVYDPIYTASRPPNPNSPHIPNVDPDPEVDEIFLSRPKMKPPGKPRKAMPGKKVGRPKVNRDPAVMLREILEKQETERKEREEARRDLEPQSEYPEGDPGLHPHSGPSSSGNTSMSGSPPTPGNSYLNPYCIPDPYQDAQHQPLVAGNDHIPDTTDETYLYGEAGSQQPEWYPEPNGYPKPDVYPGYPVLPPGAVPQPNDGHGGTSQNGLYNQSHVDPHSQNEDPEAAQGSSSAEMGSGSDSQGLPLQASYHHQTISIHHSSDPTNAPDDPQWQTHGDPSSASTPVQDWTPPNSKIELVASVIGTLIDLFPIPPSLNASVHSGFVKHVNETLLINPADGIPAFYTHFLCLELPRSDPYFARLSRLRTSEGQPVQCNPSHRFIYWDPLVLSWNHTDGLRCPACQEGLLEHGGVHEKVMRIFDVPFCDVSLDESEFDPKSFFAIGARYRCSSVRECQKRDWASWDPELCASLPAYIQALSPIEQVCDLEGALVEEDGMASCVGGLGLSRSLWRAFCAASAMLPPNRVMDKGSCLKFLATLFNVSLGPDPEVSLQLMEPTGYQQADASQNPGYDDSSANAGWIADDNLPVEGYGHPYAIVAFPDEQPTRPGYEAASPLPEDGAAQVIPYSHQSYAQNPVPEMYARNTSLDTSQSTLQPYPPVDDQLQYQGHQALPHNGLTEYNAQQEVLIVSESFEHSQYSPDRAVSETSSHDLSYQPPEDASNIAPSESIAIPAPVRGSPLLSLNPSVSSLKSATQSTLVSSRGSSPPSLDDDASASIPSVFAEGMANGVSIGSTIPAKRPCSPGPQGPFCVTKGLPFKRIRHCCKCGGQDCKGKGGHTFCHRACRDCGDPKCKGRNSRKPDRLCTEGWS